MGLLKEKRSETTRVYMVAELYELLEFEHHGDYLKMWLQQQEDLKVITKRKDRINWNLERIGELYD